MLTKLILVFLVQPHTGEVRQGKPPAFVLITEREGLSKLLGRAVLDVGDELGYYPAASLTIRDIPRPVLERLKARAERHRRSMQGEILAILESAAVEGETRRTISETLEYVRSLGLRSPAESVEMIRADRDGR